MKKSIALLMLVASVAFAGEAEKDQLIEALLTQQRGRFLKTLQLVYTSSLQLQLMLLEMKQDKQSM